jgi:hypothetical protein
MIANSQAFRDIQICLDGGTFTNCTFERCTLIYSGAIPVQLNGNDFHNCKWRFAGAAANTVSFMRALYGAGAKGLIEQMFESIRKGSPNQRHADDMMRLN